MFYNLLKPLILVALCLLLAACGDFRLIRGNGSGKSTPTPTPTPTPAPAPLCPRPLEADEMGISTAEELVAIIPLDTVRYVLTADISLAHIPNWTPLSEFFGKLDGNCYKITDMTIMINPPKNAGLFSSLNGATINNLALENVNINSVRDAGSIAARAVDSIVNNSYSTGAVNTTGGADAGGFFGYIGGTEINNSYSTATVSGESELISYIGGLVGEAEYSIINSSYSKGSITAFATDSSSAANAGGLVGRSWNSSVNNSYSKATVVANGVYAHAGGVAGAVYSGSVLKNSYSTGNITASGANPQVGGIACDVNAGTVSASVAINSQLTASSNVWRIADEAVSNSLAWDGILGTFMNKGLNGQDGEDRTAAQLRDQATYEALGWEFGEGKPWKMVNGRDHPALSWE